MDVKSARFMYQSGRAGDEAKKRESWHHCFSLMTCVPQKRLCLDSLITICSVPQPLGEWGPELSGSLPLDHPPVLYLINSRNFSLSASETFPTCLFVASMMYFSLGNDANDRTGLKLIVSQGTGQVHLSPVSL